MASKDSTFLVEIPSGESLSDFRATTVAPISAGGTIIQAIETGQKPDSYWTDWDGNYDDLPQTTFFTVFIGDRFLTQVDTLDDLIGIPYSSLVINTQVYIHIPFYLWQEENILTRIETSIGFSTNVPDPTNPSDDTFNGIRYPVRMSVPKLPIKLSDPINGINLSPTFSIDLINSDGLFDTQESSSIINNPITVRRSTTIPATYDTFTKIRVGEIENVRLTMDSFSVQGADVLRTLEDPATRTVREAELGDIDTQLPLAFGVLDSIQPIELTKVEDEPNNSITKTLILCDPDYFGFIRQAYNSDGDVVTSYSVDSNGVITNTFPLDDNTEEIASVDLYGKYGQIQIGDTTTNENTIGAIIITEIVSKSKITYTDSFWNKNEVENYAKNSATLSFYYIEGSVKKLVTEILKNDMAFLIQQNAGQLTIRRWAEYYNFHEYESWVITQKPTRIFSDFKYYYSSVIIEYGTDKDNLKSILDNSRESETISTWKKRVRGTFKSNLVNQTQALKLSSDLLDRFANRAQIWNLSIGESTSNIELLDSVIIPLIINGRKLSDFTRWKVIGIDPSQDSLILEEDSFDPGELIDQRGVPLSHPSNQNESGFLSHVLSPDESGLLSQNTINK